MKKKTVFGWLLCVCLLLGTLIAVPALAAEATEPALSGNMGDYEYVYDRWANPIKSYLVANADGTVTRVEYTGETVAAETYDADMNFVSGLTIEPELPIFGGFYYGETCNFLVFGQNNPNEDDSVEVIRVVSYTRDWQRIGAASLYGANTYIPFDAGSLRFAEYGGYLYIRTAHEMYMSEDGVHHQANVMLNVRVADMVITDSFTDVMNVNYGYVSHSFNQFVAIDGTDILTVDHGDAHPRSVVLMKYNAPAGQDSFMRAELEPAGDGYYRYTYVKSLDVLPIAGTSGANDTGVSLGGFEVSGIAYLIAGNVSPQGDAYDPYGQRNIFVAATSKEDFSSTGTTIHYLTSYVEGDEVELSNPHFTKITDDKFVLIWTETTADASTMRYAFVDGNGQLIGEVYSAKGVLSDCQPVVQGNKLVWYVTNGSAPAFFTIELDNPGNVTTQHVYTYNYTSYPSYSRDGKLSSVCMICGQAGANVTVPALSNTEHYTEYDRPLEPTCTDKGSVRYQWKDAALYSVPNYIFTVSVPATGHSWVDATCTAPKTCSICGATEGEALGHEAYTYAYADGVHTLTCTVCGEATTMTASDSKQFKINSAAPVLSDDIVLKYRVTVPAGFENAYMVFELNGEKLVVTDYTVESDGKLCFAFPGLNPQKMGDAINAYLYAEVDGTQVSVSNLAFSIVKYCNIQMQYFSSNTTLMTILSDLLVYGEKTQVYQGYKTDTLITSLCTGTLTPSTFSTLGSEYNLMAVSGTVDANVRYSSAALILSGKMKLRYTIVTANPENYVFKITLNGVTYEYTAEDLVADENDATKFYLDFDKLKATQFGMPVMATIEQDGVQISRAIQYSVYTYVYQNQNTNDVALKELLQAIYLYGESAQKA